MWIFCDDAPSLAPSDILLILRISVSCYSGSIYWSSMALYTQQQALSSSHISFQLFQDNQIDLDPALSSAITTRQKSCGTLRLIRCVVQELAYLSERSFIAEMQYMKRFIHRLRKGNMTVTVDDSRKDGDSTLQSNIQHILSTDVQ